MWVTSIRKPGFLAEVKLSDISLSRELVQFQAQTQTPHGFRVMMYLPYEPADCFKTRAPIVVPARTFLSQLW